MALEEIKKIERKLEEIKKIERKLEEIKKILKRSENKKSYNIYDKISYCNYDWYIIDSHGEYLTLMCEKCVNKICYSGKNSNDYNESNAKAYLETTFIKEINKNDLIPMKINFDEGKHTKCIIRIPTLREIEKMSMRIRSCETQYFTMTSSYGVSKDSDYACVFRVLSGGYLNISNVSSTSGLRPVISIKAESLNRKD